ncbi:aldehyde dehydrogenase family protein [Rhizobium leguminosarum]|uniref:aldehyde dehydrogenase family protein n=1 Tax=Rhizobium leguminosarum TaxID=384 RepID=UPI0019D49573|nr:aldehyde dehydrogenase family protein [Rhizobium leguminosarum]
MDGRTNFAKRVPHGIVGVISPFNFPLVLSICSIAAALAFGNATVNRPDPQTPISGAIILPASSRKPVCRRACCRWCPVEQMPARRCAPIPISR